MKDYPVDSAQTIDDAMSDLGMLDDELATSFDTEPDVVGSIRDGSLPVPPAWIPKIAGLLKIDAAILMERALGEQWFPMLRAIAAALLWQQKDIEQEWLQIIADLHDGTVPDPVDVPDVVIRLKSSFSHRQ